MTRILVVGHGLIGKQRALAISTLQKQASATTLAGTVDPIARAAHLYDAPHFADLSQVPLSSFDAAVIALPHHLAQDVARHLLSQGKPILIEKPLGMNPAQAREVASLASRLPLPSFVGYNYRYLPTLQKVFERISEGFLGELRSVDMFIGHGGHPRSNEDWKLRPNEAGGGVLMDPGVHLLDLALQLAPELTCVAAVGTRGFWETAIEEDVSAILTRGRTIISLRVSIIRWVNTFRFEFSGDTGYALVEGRGGNYGSQTLRLGRRWAWNDGTGRSQRDTEETFDFGSENRSLHDEMSAVARAWASGHLPSGWPHPATMDEAVRVAELCDQMYGQLR
jgi:predicted dehydrogenase